jgi:hypothetical protein
MTRTRILAAVFLAAASVAPAQVTRRREAPPPADAASPESIVAALYASVSHAPDVSPDFERMRGIFLYVGMLVPPVKPGEEFKVMDVDQFSERYQKGVAARKEKAEGATGFFEREIARRTDCFGKVCQIFSTYETRHTPNDEKPFDRGINSIQLVRDGKRWWIASVAWDVEKPDSPIPAPYLPAAKP